MLPIVQRELLAASRRRLIFRIRTWTAALGGIGGLSALFWADKVWWFSNSPGLFLFYLTSAGAALFCYAAGIFFTVDSISSEKRGGTLGLLFLTELNGFDIVLGKLATSSALAFSSYLTLFPIMALSLCLGGVTGLQFWMMTAALICLLFFSLSLGLCLSAFLEREGPGVVLYGILFLAPSILGIVQLLRGSPGISPSFLIMNPLYPLTVALQAGAQFTIPGIPSEYYYSSLAASLLLSACFLLAASLVTPLAFRRSAFHPFQKQRRSASLSRVKRQSPMESHPLVCLSLSRKKPMVVLWGLFALALAVFRWDPLAPLSAEFHGLAYPLLLHAILKLFLALEASRLISEAKQSGMLELLLTTPMHPGVLLGGKKTVLRRRFFLPAFFTASVHAFQILQLLLFFPGSPAIGILAGSIIILVLDFFSLGWVGLWEGMVARSASRGFIRTLIAGFAVPWLPFFFLCGLLWFLFGDIFAPPPEIFIAVGFASAAVCGLAIGCYSLARSHAALRQRIASGS